MYYLELAQQGKMPTAPIAQLLGFGPVSFKEGEVVLDYEAKKDHTNPMGTIQGGVVCTVADAAMASSYLSTLEEGEYYTTLELKINFLKPVREGKLRFVGKVIKRGSTVGLTQCEVFNEKEDLIAFATSTCMTLRGEKATLK